VQAFKHPGADGRGVRVVHRPAGVAGETDPVDESRTLASRVDRADGLLAQARGLMFRRSIPEGYALVFPFDEPRARTLHMLFVPFPIDALWLVDGEVVRSERLPAWTGFGRATADTVVELPAGAADGVREGDVVVVEE